jgi:hypothetical protein
MLGLGLGVNKSTATPKLILLDLDFETPATDFFSSYSVVGGELTFTADQTAPGVQGANFLKIQYPNANQNAVGSEISGVRNRSSLIEDSAVNPSFYWRITFDVFFETDANWTTGANNDDVQTVIQFSNRPVKRNVTTDTLTSIDTGAKQVGTESGNLLIYFNNAGDIPAANATWYIRNFTMKLGKTEASVS